MTTERKGVELFVGLFLLIGFGVIAAMILQFGRVGKGFQKSYPITVEFSNASGLLKGCDVLIAGVKIGLVVDAPHLSGGYAVVAPMSIREGVRIPHGSTFLIRTNGMLGDAYVDVVPPLNADPADFVRPNEIIPGSRVGGLEELTAKGGRMIDTVNDEVLRKLNKELDEIQVATRSINTRLLSETNLKNIEETFANLKSTTADFAQTSKDLDAVVAKTSAAVDDAKGMLKTVDGAAGDIKLAIGDFRKLTDSANSLMKKAATGEGTLGTLISDRQTAENLKALIANMRRSGVLFYKDRPLSGADAATPAPAAPRPRAR